MQNIRKSKIYKRLVDMDNGNGEYIGYVRFEISHRGGSYGMNSENVLRFLGIDMKYDGYLPNNVGAYSNYLGGGIRGSIVQSDYSKDLPKKVSEKIDQFTLACKARYQDIENDSGLNDEEYSDGETNWDAIGTNRIRKAGVKSAY